MTGYELLANAIVTQAADDYIQRLTGIGKGHLPPECTTVEIERFFRSRWFGILCRLDPDYLLAQLRAKASRLTLIYTVSKVRTSHYYVHKVGEPDKPVPDSFGPKANALRIAANMQGIRLKEYLQVRRKAGVKLD